MERSVGTFSMNWLILVERVADGETVTVETNSPKQARSLRAKFHCLKSSLKAANRLDELTSADSVVCRVEGVKAIFCPRESMPDALLLAKALGSSPLAGKNPTPQPVPITPTALDSEKTLAELGFSSKEPLS